MSRQIGLYMSAIIDFLVHCDERLFFLVNGTLASNRLDSFMEEISVIGAWPIVLIALPSLAGDGKARFLRHIILLAAALFCLGWCVRTVKSVADRDRPAAHFAKELADGSVSIRFVERRILANNSMPSGHTATAFCVMVYCALRSRAGLWAYLGLATLIGYSRVYVGLHFPGDAMAGALLGTLLGTAGWQGYLFWARRRPLPPYTRTATL